jgi:hypothetical protein
MAFVNIHGQPVDMATMYQEQARNARLLRCAGIPEKRKPTVKNGYAAPPGTGPDGKTCKDCTHKRSMANGAKHFIKCELRRATWTRGEGTDILARSPACSQFAAIAASKEETNG